MMNTDESALACDLAETYHIYDFRELSVSKIALFSVGLRENSRIKLKINGMKYPFEIMLFAGILDKVSLLVWQNTKDAINGTNMPRSILQSLLNIDGIDNREHMTFNSPDEFENMRRQILRGE